jgi:hypothetical protein
MTNRAVHLGRCLEKPNCNARTLVTGYFLKGGDAAVRKAFAVPSNARASAFQGVIDGKRVGVSRPIGAQAIESYFATSRSRLSNPPAQPREGLDHRAPNRA